MTPQKTKSDPFVRGKHITWQQYEILSAVERGLSGEAPRRISIASGHGIGKTAVIAWLLLWYLFCFKDAQIPCTAPTADQMFDVAWKEVAKWLGKMPDEIRAVYEWSTTYVRIKDRPETWFARAKTARKEAPEALAGIHGDYVMMLVDEASGVDDVIYRTAEGALTSGNIFVILISNPTRLIGYFYDTHHRDKDSWQTLQFSSLDSPVVENEYVERIKNQHGEDSDEYRIRVLGQFPKEDAVDEQGYVPLLTQPDIKFTEDTKFQRDLRLGVDPSGEGDDETVWVLRDNFKAQVIAREKISTPKGIAQRTLSIMEMYKIPPQNVYLDSFGVGANALQQLAASSYDLTIFDQKVKYMAVVTGVNAGEKPDDDERYLNRRAEMYYRIKDWIRHGGEFVRDDGWEELLTIRYRPELSGKLKIMSKQDMRKLGYRSPNVADALSLTFFDDMIYTGRFTKQNDAPTDRYGLFAEV